MTGVQTCALPICVAFCVALSVVGCDSAPTGPQVDLTFVKESGERTAILRVEVAATPEARAKGLSHRYHPGSNRGLLLMYPSPNEYLVSNEHVADPVDFAFVAPNGHLLGVISDVPAGDDTPRTIGASSSAIIILGAGIARQLGLSRGDMVMIQGQLPKVT